MDVRRFTPEQLHTLDLAAAGGFLAILHEAMIIGDYVDCDVSVDRHGPSYRIELIFSAGQDGCLGKMARLVIENATALPEAVRLGLLLLRADMALTRARESAAGADERVARILAARAARG